MKNSILLGLILLPAIGMAQAVDTAAVIREVDSLIQVSRELTGRGELEKALEINVLAEKLTLDKLGRETVLYGSVCSNHGRVLYFQGKYAETEKWFLEALANRKTLLGTDHAEYAKSLNSLAALYFTTGRYDAAEPLYLESKTIREKVFGREHPEYAASLSNLALLYTNLGRYETAVSLYLEAKTLEEKILGKEHPDYANTVDNLGILYYHTGRYNEAEPLYLEAKAIWEKTTGKGDRRYANCLNNLAALYFALGQFKLSEEYYLEAIEIREKILGKEHPDFISSLNNLAVLYTSMGRYEAVKPLYLEVKAIREKVLGVENPDYANSLISLATLNVYLGHYEAVEPLFLNAKNILEKTLGKSHPRYASILMDLAGFYFTIGRYRAAESLYMDALSIQEKALGKEHPDYASNLDNLAALYARMGRFDSAEPLFIKAKNIREKALGKEHPDYAISTSNLATFYYDTKQYKAAEPLYREAKEIEETVAGKEHPDYASSLNNLGALYFEMKQFEVAELLFLEAKSIRETKLGKGHPDYAKSTNNLAALYAAKGQYEPAGSLYFEANNIQRHLITKSSQHLSEQELFSFIQIFVQNLAEYFSFAQINIGMDPEFSGSCYDNALFHKGFLLTASQQLKHLAESDTGSTKLTEALMAHHRLLGQEYSKPIAERKNVQELEEKTNLLEKELVRKVPGYGEALRQVGWQEVRDKLKPGEVAVEFIHYQFYNPNATDSVFYSALVLRPGDKAPLFIPLFEERRIRPLLEGAKSGNIQGIDALYTLGGSTSLYDMIWKPLERSLQGVTTVYCSAAGLLHRLNLGAIPSNQGKTFSELHKLVLLGSTRQLVVPQVFKTAGNSAYVAGGIRYEMDAKFAYGNPPSTERGISPENDLRFEGDSTARGGSWRYMPASATEAIEIGKILKQQKFTVQLDTGYAATEESFKRLGGGEPSPRTILLATHGFFFPDPKPEDRDNKISGALSEPVFRTSDHPLIRSGLVLAGAQQAWATGKGLENREDGILTAYEISHLNLSGTELVVLSACETGLGDIVGNEGVYGLQRAFKIAGAKYLIMSLWKVNDQSTSEFMIEFYRQWLERKRSIPEAFGKAQQIMKIKYKDSPYHWAGFVLVE